MRLDLPTVINVETGWDANIDQQEQVIYSQQGIIFKVPEAMSVDECWVVLEHKDQQGCPWGSMISSTSSRTTPGCSNTPENQLQARGEVKEDRGEKGRVPSGDA